MFSRQTLPIPNIFLLLISSILFHRLMANSFETIWTSSGRVVHLSELRMHTSNLELQELYHVLFEIQNDTFLASRYVRIKLSDYPIIEAPVYKEARTYHDTKASGPYHVPIAPLVRTGLGFTFIFSATDGQLLAGWGPGLQLHPVRLSSGARVYLNAAWKLSAKHVKRGYLRTKWTTDALIRSAREELMADTRMEEPCEDIYWYEVSVAFDKTFCDLYEGSDEKTRQVVHGLINSMYVEFWKKACVGPRLDSYGGYCATETYPEGQNFKPPANLNMNYDGSENQVDKEQSTSHIMVNYVKRDWQNSYLKENHWDGAFLLTGYGDKSSLAGAAYTSSACNTDFSFGWVKLDHLNVFAHEIGHQLGAGHDTEGVMSEKLTGDSKFFLSERSAAEIRVFLERNPNSWCLKRNRFSYKALVKDDMWSRSTLENIYAKNVTSFDICDTAVLKSQGPHSRSTVIVLLTQNTNSDTRDEKYLFISSLSGIICPPNSYCDLPNSLQKYTKLRFPAPGYFDQAAFEFGVSVAAIQNKSSQDLVVSYLERRGDGIQFHYRIGYDVSEGDIGPKKWSTQYSMPKLLPGDITDASIATGFVRKGSTPDILLMVVRYINSRYVIYYYVGFDIRRDGLVRGGWSDGILYNGWVGKVNTDVSVVLSDVNRDGNLDLVIHDHDSAIGEKCGYLTLGIDINKTGHVASGWTRPVQLPFNESNKAYGNASIVLMERKGDAPAVILVQKEETRKGEKAWILYGSSEVLTKKVLRTKEIRPAQTNVEDGCFECFPPDMKKSCVRKQRICGSKIDEVHIEKDSSKESVMRPVTKEQALHLVSFKVDGSQINGRYPPDGFKQESLYCAGFYYLYTTNNGCRAFDRDTVTMRGLLFLTAQSLRDTESLQNVTIQTEINEDPLGTSNHLRRPSATITVIVGRDRSYERVVKFFLRRLKKERRWVFDDYKYDVYGEKGRVRIYLFRKA